MIHTFVSRYPGVDLELVESDSMALYEEALKDNIDLIFDAGAYDASCSPRKRCARNTFS